MLAYDRHFSNPVIGGTGHAQCNIWSYYHGREHRVRDSAFCACAEVIPTFTLNGMLNKTISEEMTPINHLSIYMIIITGYYLLIG